MDCKVFSSVLIVLMFFSLNMIAQDVNFQVRLSQLSSLEDNGDSDDCYEVGEEEYRYNVWVRDDVDPTETSATCIQCNTNGNCILTPDIIIRTKNTTAATSVTLRFQGWEEDTGDNCISESFTFSADDCNCGALQMAVISFRNDPAGQWNSYGPYGCGSHSVSIEIMYDIVLPVDLVEFEGYPEKGYNYLEWVTASEHNTDFFQIQRSVDGKEWKAINEVQAEGESNDMLFYEFNDFKPLSAAYYRLRIVDFDGQEEYSNTVFLENDFAEKKSVIENIYPNPSSGDFTIQFSDLEFSENLNVLVVNTLGKLVKQEQITANLLNDNNWKVSLKDAPNGMYFLRIQDKNGNIFTEKLYKKTLLP